MPEVKRLTKSGEELTLFASFTPMRDKEGVIIGETAFYKNITNLKKTERELRKSRETYRIVTENSFDVIQLTSTAGMIEYVSPSNEKVLGYTLGEYIGKPFTKYIHPHDIPRLEKGFKDLLSSDDPEAVALDLQFLHKKGHYIWVEAISTPVIVDGKVTEIVTTTRDITVRKGSVSNYRGWLFMISCPVCRTGAFFMIG